MATGTEDPTVVEDKLPPVTPVEAKDTTHIPIIIDDQEFQLLIEKAEVTPRQWTKQNVCKFLEINGLPTCAISLAKYDVDGTKLLKMNKETLALKIEVKLALIVARLIAKLRTLDAAHVKKNRPPEPTPFSATVSSGFRIPKRKSETPEPCRGFDSKRGRGGYNRGGYNSSSATPTKIGNNPASATDDEDWGASSSTPTQAPSVSQNLSSTSANCDDEDWGDGPSTTPATTVSGPTEFRIPERKSETPGPCRNFDSRGGRGSYNRGGRGGYKSNWNADTNSKIGSSTSNFDDEDWGDGPSATPATPTPEPRRGFDSRRGRGSYNRGGGGGYKSNWNADTNSKIGSSTSNFDDEDWGDGPSATPATPTPEPRRGFDSRRGRGSYNRGGGGGYKSNWNADTNSKIGSSTSANCDDEDWGDGPSTTSATAVSVPSDSRMPERTSETPEPWRGFDSKREETYRGGFVSQRGKGSYNRGGRGGYKSNWNADTNSKTGSSTSANFDDENWGDGPSTTPATVAPEPSRSFDSRRGRGSYNRGAGGGYKSNWNADTNSKIGSSTSANCDDEDWGDGPSATPATPEPRRGFDSRRGRGSYNRGGGGGYKSNWNADTNSKIGSSNSANCDDEDWGDGPSATPATPPEPRRGFDSRRGRGSYNRGGGGGYKSNWNADTHSKIGSSNSANCDDEDWGDGPSTTSATAVSVPSDSRMPERTSETPEPWRGFDSKRGETYRGGFVSQRGKGSYNRGGRGGYKSNWNADTNSKIGSSTSANCDDEDWGDGSSTTSATAVSVPSDSRMPERTSETSEPWRGFDSKRGETYRGGFVSQRGRGSYNRGGGAGYKSNWNADTNSKIGSSTSANFDDEDWGDGPSTTSATAVSVPSDSRMPERTSETPEPWRGFDSKRGETYRGGFVSQRGRGSYNRGGGAGYKSNWNADTNSKIGSSTSANFDDEDWGDGPSTTPATVTPEPSRSFDSRRGRGSYNRGAGGGYKSNWNTDTNSRVGSLTSANFEDEDWGDGHSTAPTTAVSPKPSTDSTSVVGIGDTSNARSNFKEKRYADKGHSPIRTKVGEDEDWG